ncbi:MAG: hypothetical protein P4M09_00410 [Devosia sp.]|nr:hypothetical protein [Devosia sp.]
MMTEDPDRAARERMLADLLVRVGLPQAPLAMPKQTLESQPRWLFAIYARLLRRT